MPFLPPNQQHQSTEGRKEKIRKKVNKEGKIGKEKRKKWEVKSTRNVV